MASFTTANLLSSINMRNFAPTGQTTYSTSDILQIADEELKTLILPEILSVREEFFVHYVDYQITAGQESYDIPPRAIGMVVRDVKYYDGSGGIKDLTRIEPEDLDSVSQTAGIPDQFWLENNVINLYRIPSSTTGTLRVSFFLSPGSFIETTAASVISEINTTTKVLSLTTIPSTWATGKILDLIKSDGGQEYLAFDLTSVLISGNDVTLPSLPSRLKVGDYVAPQGESPLVQLPNDFRPVLAQAVAYFIIENMNIPGSEKSKAKLDKMMKSAIDMIVPRTQGSPRRVLTPSWI